MSHHWTISLDNLRWRWWILKDSNEWTPVCQLVIKLSHSLGQKLSNQVSDCWNIHYFLWNVRSFSTSKGSTLRHLPFMWYKYINIHLPRPQMRPHILEALGPHKMLPEKKKYEVSWVLGTHIHSDQMIIFHQPKSPWNGSGSGISLTKPPFGVKNSCEIAIHFNSFQHPCGEPTVRTLLSSKPPCISYTHIILWLWMCMVQNYQPCPRWFGKSD